MKQLAGIFGLCCQAPPLTSEELTTLEACSLHARHPRQRRRAKPSWVTIVGTRSPSWRPFMPCATPPSTPGYRLGRTTAWRGWPRANGRAAQLSSTYPPKKSSHLAGDRYPAAADLFAPPARRAGPDAEPAHAPPTGPAARLQLETPAPQPACEVGHAAFWLLSARAEAVAPGGSRQASACLPSICMPGVAANPCTLRLAATRPARRRTAG
jgi:hypothetical protein